MKRLSSCMVIVLLLAVLLAAAMPVAFMPAAAAGIPGDEDGNNRLTEAELAGNMLDYLRGWGDLSLEDVRDAAHVFAYWDGKPRTVVDTARRTVTIYKPVKRIVVLSSDSARAVRILGAEDKVVGISETVQKFPFYFPEMSQKPVVGTWREVDWECIVKLNPDLVIIPPTGTISADVAEEKLEPFGITVIGLYMYVTEDYDQLFDEVEKLAILLEKEEEAARYTGWHDAYVARIQDFVAGKEKPKVFLTYTSGAIGKKSDIKSYGPGSTLYLLCEKAGGRAITEHATEIYPSVNAEWVLTENPEVMVMLCGNVFGWWDGEAEPKELVGQLLEGKTWEGVNATVNGRIYAVPWSITNGLEQICGVVLLAKICYPELDINPGEVNKEFLEEFMRVKYPEGEGKVLAYSDSMSFTT